mmetsp:Transcript_19236/g.37179  ORF Transcript_19236/g.37179 Transcript_19236/m.37179 type:complete len:1294 (+) Transcript_19236:645-4526(+)
MRNEQDAVLSDLELAARLHRELNSLRRDRPHSRRHEMSDGVLGAPLGSSGSARHHAFSRRGSHSDSESSCSDSDIETTDRMAQQISDDDVEGVCLDERYTSDSGEDEASFERDRVFSSETASSLGASRPPEAALPRTAAGRLALKRWKERLARDKDKMVEEKPPLNVQGCPVVDGPNLGKHVNGTDGMNLSNGSEVVSAVNWKDMVKLIGRNNSRFKPATFSLPESFFRSAGLFVAGSYEGQRRPLGRPRKHPLPDPTAPKRPRGRPPLPRPVHHSRSPASSSSPSREKRELQTSETPSSSRTEREQDHEVESDLGCQETEPSSSKLFPCSSEDRAHKQSSRSGPPSSFGTRNEKVEPSSVPKQRGDYRRQITDSSADTSDIERANERKRTPVQSASTPNAIPKHAPAAQDLFLYERGSRIVASTHSSEKYKASKALLKQDEELALKLHRELNSRTSLSIALPRPSRVRRHEKPLEAPKQPTRDPSSDSSSVDEDSDDFEMSSESEEEEDSVATAQYRSGSSSASSLDLNEMQAEAKKRKLRQAVKEMGGGSLNVLSPMPLFVLGKESKENDASLVCGEKPLDLLVEQPASTRKVESSTRVVMPNPLTLVNNEEAELASLSANTGMKSGNLRNSDEQSPHCKELAALECSGRHRQLEFSNDPRSSMQPKQDQDSQQGPCSTVKDKGNMAPTSKSTKAASHENELKLELKTTVSHEDSDSGQSLKRISRRATSSLRGNKGKGGKAATVPSPAVEVKVCGTENGERPNAVVRASMAKDKGVESMRKPSNNVPTEKDFLRPKSKLHGGREKGSHSSDEIDEEDDGLAMLSMHTAIKSPLKFNRLRKQQEEVISNSPATRSSGIDANKDSTANISLCQSASSSKPASQVTTTLRDFASTPTTEPNNLASMKLAVCQTPSQVLLKTNLESAMTTMAPPSSLTARQDNSPPCSSNVASSNPLSADPVHLPQTSDPSLKPFITEGHSTCKTSDGALRSQYSLQPTSAPAIPPSDKRNMTAPSFGVAPFPTTPSSVLSQTSGEVSLPHEPRPSGPSTVGIDNPELSAAATNPAPATWQTPNEQTNPTSTAMPPVCTPLTAPSRMTSVLGPTPEAKIASSLRAQSNGDSPAESKQTAMSAGAKDAKGKGCRKVNSNAGGVVQDKMAKKRTSPPVDWRPLKKRLLDSVPLAEPELPKMQVDTVEPDTDAKDEHPRQEPHGKKKRTGKRAPRKDALGAGATVGCSEGLLDHEEGGMASKKYKGKEARTTGRGYKVPKNHIMELEDAAALMSVLSGRAMNQYALQ